jgi:hypothetical protein
MNTRKKKLKRSPSEIGWREFVSLPELSISRIRAKIDTGARTSALHATNQRLLVVGNEEWVEFHVPVAGTSRSTRCRARLVAKRNIKNTSGNAEERFIIKTTLILGKRRWPIEVSLANRDNMGFDLILGRTAIRNRKLLVNPGRSYLVGTPRSRLAAA